MGRSHAYHLFITPGFLGAFSEYEAGSWKDRQDHGPYSLEWCIVLTLARYASVGSWYLRDWEAYAGPTPSCPGSYVTLSNPPPSVVHHFCV